MADTTGVNTPAVTAAAVPSTDAATLQMLVQLLLAERQEAMLERQSRTERRIEQDKQHKMNAEQLLKDKKTSQSLCTHKKGGKGLKGPKVDYAVSFHTFVGSQSYIRCLVCGMKWKNTDTAEFLTRRGEKIPNHTGISWKEAYRMVTESSNTATSSEVMLTASLESAPKPDFSDSRAVEI
jgi:hypothetical protein